MACGKQGKQSDGSTAARTAYLCRAGIHYTKSLVHKVEQKVGWQYVFVLSLKWFESSANSI